MATENIDSTRLLFSRLPSKLLPASERLLYTIKQVEKRTFPANEAFDFDAEIKKRTTAVYCVYRKGKDGAELCAYGVYVRSKLLTRIHKVCVVEQYRRQGIGKWMMKMLLGELAKASTRSVDLWVDADRIPARQLYLSCGFQEKETVQDYYCLGHDGIRMQLDANEFKGT